MDDECAGLLLLFCHGSDTLLRRRFCIELCDGCPPTP